MAVVMAMAMDVAMAVAVVMAVDVAMAVVMVDSWAMFVALG
jgi:hypothetical protein